MSSTSPSQPPSPEPSIDGLEDLGFENISSPPESDLSAGPTGTLQPRPDHPVAPNTEKPHLTQSHHQSYIKEDVEEAEGLQDYQSTWEWAANRAKTTSVEWPTLQEAMKLRRTRMESRDDEEEYKLWDGVTDWFV
jgi:hypothetical protein